MAQSTFTCPVCGQTLSAGDTFCGNCGFEIHILTEPVSEKILSYEKERVKKFRSILDGNSSMKTGLESSLSEARSEAEEAKERHLPSRKGSRRSGRTANFWKRTFPARRRRALPSRRKSTASKRKAWAVRGKSP
ncbi:MAG: zinc ribbon domain-containing protein [Bacteroidales bacterium]|nr:zinc ribbon domain-containing protein [Bacteroidales bacterium]